MRDRRRADEASISPISRIDQVEMREDVEQIGVLFPHAFGFVEEEFGGNGKEFGFVRGAVVIEEGAGPGTGGMLQRRELLVANLGVTLVIGGVVERRSPIGAPIEHVELVGELVQNDIVAALGMAPAANGVPHQNDGTAQVRFTK